MLVYKDLKERKKIVLVEFIFSNIDVSHTRAVFALLSDSFGSRPVSTIDEEKGNLLLVLESRN